DVWLVRLCNPAAGPFWPSAAAGEWRMHEHGPQVFLGYYPLDLGSPRYASGEWSAVFATLPFEPLQGARLPNPQDVDREALVAFYASMGWLADLPDAERLPLLAEVRSLLSADEYRRSWETHLHWARLA